MNKLTIIGNLTRDPELRTTPSGVSVCTFTVAVSRKKSDEADYFRVTAWRERGEICAKWLIKGRKVCVVGPVSVSTYQGQDGKVHANLEVNADEVEFLSSKSETFDKSGMQKVDVENPFTEPSVVQQQMDELPWG
jgi:single-strand DNA-binding protein